MITRREVMLRAILLLVSTALAFGALEVVFRVGLFSASMPIERLRYPWRFGDHNFDEDYWKLAYLFGTGRRATRVGGYHPLLGWAPKTTRDNPLGLISGKPYQLADLSDPVLFYGNSFVAGVTPVNDRLPQALDPLFPSRPVLNYGVGGYGVGQIYLRMVSTVDLFEHPVVLVGILTADLDRTVLKFRSGQKPVYRVVGDSLVLENLPIVKNSNQYVREHPPAVKSYLGRFLLFRARDIIPEGLFNRIRGYTTKHQDKLVVNRRLLRAMRDDVAQRGIPLYGVIFYARSEFEEESWRSEYLRASFRDLGIPAFDTKAFLLDYMVESDETLLDLYDVDNGHPNARGNAILASGLRDWLVEQGL